MPSKVILLRSTYTINQLQQKLPDNTPAAWMWVTKDSRQAVESFNYFRKDVRTLDVMSSIYVYCVEQTDAETNVTKWAEREYRVEWVDRAAQVVEIVPFGEWREFGKALRKSEPTPETKKARA